MFHLKLLIRFLLLSIADQIDWHIVGFFESASSVLKSSRSLVSFCSDLSACCVLTMSSHFCVNTLFGMPSGTTIIMAVQNNKDILMVPYEDLPDKDKDVISKAIENF